MQEDVSHHSIYFAKGHKRCNQSAIIRCHGFKITKKSVCSLFFLILPQRKPCSQNQNHPRLKRSVSPVITELSLRVLAQALMM